MSTSVCLSVCVSVCPRAYLPNHIRDLYQLFLHVAYCYGSVLLWRGDDIPKGSGNFEVFFPTDNALYSIAIGTHTKTADQSRCRLGWWLGWAQISCVRWETRSPSGRGVLWGSGNLVMGHSTVRCAKNGWTDRDAVLNEDTGGPTEPHFTWECRSPRGMGNFRGLSWPFKSIGNLRCTGRCSCKRDHSIANNVMRQKGSLSMPEKRQ